MKTQRPFPFRFAASAFAVIVACILFSAQRTLAQSPPTVGTLPASAVAAAGTNTRATLNGTANPQGASAVAWFEWGRSNVNEYATVPVAIGGGSSGVPVSDAISNLLAGVHYHYRVAASNSFGVTRGADQWFWAPGILLNGPSCVTNECHASVFEDSGVTVSSPCRASISAGDYHTLALGADGRVVGWGANQYGQANGSLAATNVLAIASRGHFNLALRPDGRIFGWGDNTSGQTNCPASATNVIAIAAGEYHGLAARAGGTVVCWGDNSYGQLNTPAGATNVIAVGGGEYYSLALRANGTMVGWGYNNFGETSGAAAANGVAAIAAGFNHVLVLRTNGSVVAWGRNYEGQTTVPPGATNVVAIAAGAHHSLALRADGVVIGWGNNNYGQASGASAVSNAVAIAGGRWHSLAVRADGTTVGWGRNDAGQITIPAAATNLNLIAGLSGSVDTNTPAAYVLTYSATNASGAVGAAGLTVVVEDTRAPALTLVGDNPLTHQGGTPYVEPGATAADECGGDLTALVVTNINVNPDVPGTYTNTYTVMDASGNSASTNRIVTVEGLPATVTTLPPTEVISIEANAGATLNGTVNPNGIGNTLAWFEWGTNAEYGAVAGSTEVGGGTNAVLLTAALTNLAAGTEYRYRLVASNLFGLWPGPDQCLGPLRIVLAGANPVILQRGTAFVDPGYSVVDPCSPPFSGGTGASGAVDTDTVGTYVLTYTATNTPGARACAARTVNVVASTTTSIVYVNQNAPVGSIEDGTSWTNAYRELRDALVAVNPTVENPIEIWVAKGTYKPTAGLDRNASFVLKSGMKIRGGFAGNETSSADRPLFDFPAVLSGDIGVAQTNALTDTYNPWVSALVWSFDREDPGYLDNCYNVISGTNVSGVELDLIFIAGGNANDDSYSELDVKSMGMGKAITDDTVEVTGETVLPLDRVVAGGGLYLVNPYSAPVTNRWDIALIECFFINNSARGYGGAAALREVNAQLWGCSFLENYADEAGGALCGQNLRHLYLASGGFFENEAGGSGGAIHLNTLPTDRNTCAAPNASLRETQQIVSADEAVYHLSSVLWETFAGPQFIEMSWIAKSEMPVAARALAAYEILCLAVDLVDVSLELAEAYGADLDEGAVHTWQTISAGFHKYATPEGWASMLADLLVDAIESGAPPNAIERHALKQWQRFLYNPDPHRVIGGIEFYGNSAGGNGGAIECVHDNIHLENCVFELNTAAGDGGALASSSYNRPRLTSCAFQHNHSDGGHSGMVNMYHSDARILNCTWFENSSSNTNGFCIGNAMGSEVRIANSILWGNTNPALTNCGADIFTATPDTILQSGTNLVDEYNQADVGQMNYWGITDISYSCVQGLHQLPVGVDELHQSMCYWLAVATCSYSYNPVVWPKIVKDLAMMDDRGLLDAFDYLNTGYGNRPKLLAPEGHNTDRNPQFEPVDTGRTWAPVYAPSWLSPAIDAGNTSRINPVGTNFLNWTRSDFTSETDIDLLFLPRVHGTSVDMGAVEYQGDAGVLYVRAGATGDNTGYNWENAVPSLAQALSMIDQRGVQVWVAAGTYYPATSGSRLASFSLPDGVSVYGGFNGTETNLWQRDAQANQTILSGDIGTPGWDGDNSYHVISNAYLRFGTALEGFTITGGRANGAGETNGGGMYLFHSEVTVRNCSFVDNQASGDGGGFCSVSVYNANASHLSDCVFKTNTALRGGAAAFRAPMEAENCWFERNTAGTGGAVAVLDAGGVWIGSSLFLSNSVGGQAASRGGALFSSGTGLRVGNCTFYGNAAAFSGYTGGGGALDYQGGPGLLLRLENGLFWKNTATNQGGGAIPVDRQQIAWANAYTDIRYNFIEGLTTAFGAPQWCNWDQDPVFADEANGDLRLSMLSPAIDAGTTSAHLTQRDLDGYARIANRSVDLGAFEHQGPPAVQLPVRVTRLVDETGVVYRVDVLAGGQTPIGCQWEMGTGGSYAAVTNGSVYQGATTPSLKITNPTFSMNGYEYRVQGWVGTNFFVSKIAVLQVPPPVLYVKADAAGANNGADWANAFTQLDDALVQVADGCEIWVAAGVYHPYRTLGEAAATAAYPLRSYVRVYGGFGGMETNQAQRDWRLNATVLSGDIGVTNEPGDNCLTVLHGSRCAGAVLDGFTVRDAAGGALQLDNGSASVRNCVFERNRAEYGGAAMSLLSATLLSTNCVFRDNVANEGAISVAQSTLWLANCLLCRNSAGVYGGAIESVDSRLFLLNCTVADNSSRYAGGGIYQDGGTNRLFNSVLWGNHSDEFGTTGLEDQLKRRTERPGILDWWNCCIQGLPTSPWLDGNANLCAEPWFVNFSAGDYRLLPHSPLVDMGSDTWTSGLETDLDGAARAFGIDVDIGAFELQTNAADRVWVTYSPEPVVGCPGDASVLRVTGMGTFRWQVNDGGGFVDATNGGSFTINEQYGSSTLTVSPVLSEMDGWEFRFRDIMLDFYSPPVQLQVQAPAVIYVNTAAAGANNGQDWANAFTNLQQALSAAGPCTELWVAEGLYRPGYHLAFRPPSGTALYGGFSGVETNRTERDWANHPTVLEPEDRHTVEFDRDLKSWAVLDGFTVTGSSDYSAIFVRGVSPMIRNCTFTNNSDECIQNWDASPTIDNCAFVNNTGPCIGNRVLTNGSCPLVVNCLFSNNSLAIFNGHCAPTISNCVFVANHNEGGYGSAIYNWRDRSNTNLFSPVIAWCAFRDNVGAVGGAIYSDQLAAPSIAHCEFTGNRGHYGGALYSDHGSRAAVTNCLFAGNTVTSRGGAILHRGDSLTLVNCTLADNVASVSGGAIRNEGNNLELRNDILWDNAFTGSWEANRTNAHQIDDYAGTAEITFCIVEGMTFAPASSNLWFNPLFRDPRAGDYRLTVHSPALNAGDFWAVPYGSVDLDGLSRFSSTIPDLGAYEFQDSPSYPLSIFALPESAGACESGCARFEITHQLPVWCEVVWQQQVGETFVDITNDATCTVTTGDGFSALEITNALPAMNGQAYRLQVYWGDPVYTSPPFNLTVFSPTILHVDSRVAISGDGLSWSNAFASVREAVAVAGDCSEIWVAGGTYPATSPFMMRSGLRIYGGFAGTEAALEQRDWTNYPTVLQSGSGGIIYNSGTQEPVNDTALLDGFTLTGAGSQPALFNHAASPTIAHCIFEGNATHAVLNQVQSSPIFTNCVFRNNAAAMYNSESSPTIENCVFLNNHSSNQGPAVGNMAGSPRFVGCDFIGNSAEWGGAVDGQGNSSLVFSRCRFLGNSATIDGGAISLNGAAAVLTDCLFAQNAAGYMGGALKGMSSSFTLYNCTLSRNTATYYGGGLYLQWGSANIYNSILWNNSDHDTYGTIESAQIRTETSFPAAVSASYSCIQGLQQYAGNGNSAFDPLFANAAAGNYTLSGCSPAVDSGNNGTTGGETLDLEGNPRIASAAVDRGAYELQSGPSGSVVQVYLSPESQATCPGGSVRYFVKGLPGSATNFHWWYLADGQNPVSVPADGYHWVQSAGDTSTLIISNVPSSFEGRLYQLEMDAAGGGYWWPPVALILNPRTVIYVRAGATGANNGTDWANAYTSLPPAIDRADECSDLWVASGTYTQTGNTWSLKNRLAVYGGFNGTETNAAQRDWVANPTILSRNGSGTLFTHYQIVLDRSTRLDGFILENAFAGIDNIGVSPTIENCVFRSLSDHGIYNENSQPLIRGCVFTNIGEQGVLNLSGSAPAIENSRFVQNGWAIHGQDSGLTVAGCVFSNNSHGILQTHGSFQVTNSLFAGNSSAFYLSDGSGAVSHCAFRGNTGYRGAALDISSGSVSVVNCLFSGNFASDIGAAIYADSGSLAIRNCTITGNRCASLAAGVFTMGGASVYNSILWNNWSDAYGGGLGAQFYGTPSAYANNSVQGGGWGWNTNPLFVQGMAPATAPTVAGDYHLMDASPLIDAGLNAQAAGIAADLDGLPRFVRTNIDLGPYEFQCGAATMLAFITPPQVLIPGELSDAITVQRQDNLQRAVSAEPDVLLTLSSSSGTGVFRDLADTMDLTNVTIVQGTSSSSFRYRDASMGMPILTVSAPGLGSVAQTQTVTQATRLAFTTPPRTLEFGGVSDPITVARQDDLGNPVSGEADVEISLASSSGTGRFRDVDDATNLTSIIIAQGTSSANFRYHDTMMGEPVLTASAPGLISATQTQMVTRLNQTITFGALPGRVYGDAPFVVSATASSGLPVSFSIISGPATVTSNLLTIMGAGTVTVRASQAGDPTYQPAPNVDRPFTVAKAVLTVVVDDAQRVYGDPDPVFTGTITGLQYDDVITATYAAAVTGTTPPGVYPIVPTFVDPLNRLPNYTLNINNGTLMIHPGPATQLAFITPPCTIQYGELSSNITVQLQDVWGFAAPAETNVLLALSSSSTNGVFRDLADSTSLTSLVLTQANSSVSFRYRDTQQGSPVLTVSAEGFISAVQTQAITLWNQTITFAALPGRAYGDAPFTLNAMASSGLPVSFSITAGPATVTSNELTITGAGLVTVRASQAGGAGYEPAPDIDRSFTVAPALLTVVADDSQREYGEPDPVFAGTLTGIQYGDDITASYAALGPPAATNPPVFDRAFGNDRLWYPDDAAVDGNGNVYVANSADGRVYKFNSNGVYLTRWSVGSPTGVAVDRSNHVYVTEYSGHRVRKLTADGVEELQWGSYGSGNGQFNHPCKIAVDANDNVYVGDADNHRIQKFTSEGVYLTKWGGYGTGPGQFNLLYGGMAFDTNGNVYVADYMNNRIQKFTVNGSYLSQWGTYGTNIGQLWRPQGIVLDSNGDVIVAEQFNSRVQKFTPDGQCLAHWGALGTANGQFDQPEDLAIASGDVIYVVDTRNIRIQKFRPAYGLPVTAATPPGAYPIVPTLLDPAGKLANYVVSSTNGTLTIHPGAASKLVFASPPQTLGVGMSSGPITVERRDNSEFPVLNEPDLVVSLETSSGTGVFRDLADTTNLTSVTIVQGANSATFRYRDDTSGLPVLTVSAVGLSSATQTQTVVQATQLAFTTAPHTFEAGGISGSITVERQDDAAQPVINAPDQVVILASSSGGGVFRNVADTMDLGSITITQGSSSVSFRYRDSLPGSPVLTVTASGLASAMQTQAVSRISQTITFASLPGRAYGDEPFALNPTASSGLPVSCSIVSGEATVSSNVLTITGAGPVTVRASQAGDAMYLPAADVDRSFTVAQAMLAVDVDDAERGYGEPDPVFTGTIAGLQYGDVITATYAALGPPPPTDPPLFDRAFGSDRLSYPSDMAVDGAGNIYVVCSYTVYRYNSEGVYMTQWGEYGNGAGEFMSTSGIAVDRSNHVYVADEYMNRIQKFTADGTYLLGWGTPGTGNGQFNQPWHLASDSAGNVYVADTQNYRVQKFTSNGVYLAQWGGYGTGNGQFRTLRGGIAVGTNSIVYVADYENSRIQKFTCDGVFLGKWGSYGTGPGQFSYPSDVALDSDGNVYVSEWGHRIQKFTPDGAYLTQWGGLGSGNGQFNVTISLAINSTNEVYVADRYNHRIQKFRPGYGPPVTPETPPGNYPILPSFIDPESKLANYLASITNGTLTILPDAAASLAFASAPYTLETGELSGAITVQRQDNHGFAVSAEPDLVVTLASSSGAGVFRDLADTTDLSSVTITQGSSTASFRYRDGTTGSPILTIWAAGMSSATQTQLVTTATRLVFTTPPRTMEAGALSGMITVQRQDDTGRPIATHPDVEVLLSSSSGGGVFRDVADTTNVVSVTIAQGTNSASFRYRDTESGAPVLTAEAAGLVSATQTQTVTRLSQTITFAALPSRAYGDPPFALSATASSGLPVSFGILSGPATVTNELLTITGAGTITVRASQAGNAAYQPAPNVDRPFAVAKAALTVVAADAARGYGQPDPVFTGTMTGIQYGDPITAAYAALGPPTLTNPPIFELAITRSGFNYPMDVELDTNGNVYASAGNYVYKFNAAGLYLTNWGGSGTANGKFAGADGLALDHSNHVYVVDTFNHRVQKFTTGGIFVLKWGSQGSGNGQFNTPRRIAVDDSGNVYVGDESNYRVQKFTSEGVYLTQWGSQGWGNGQFQYLSGGIAIDTNGLVYVADTFNNRIQKFTSTGTYLGQWGTFGTNPGQFDRPVALAFDPGGHLYVGEREGDRVQKFTTDGTYLTGWGGSGSANGQFDFAFGVAVNATNAVYVTDYGNHRIQKFKPGYGPPVTSDTPPGTYPIVPTLLDPLGRLVNYSVTLTNGTLTIYAVLEPPEFLGITAQPGQTFRLQCSGSPSTSYTLQTSSNLADWTDCTSLLSDTNGLFEYLETAETNAPARFYRLRQ